MSYSSSTRHPPRVADYRPGGKLRSDKKLTVKNAYTALQDPFWDWRRNSFEAVVKILKTECDIAIRILQQNGDLYINETSTYRRQSKHDRQLLYMQIREQIQADMQEGGPKKYLKYDTLLFQMLSCTNDNYLSMDESGSGEDNWLVGYCFDGRMHNDKRKKPANPRSLLGGVEEGSAETGSTSGLQEEVPRSRYSTIHDILNQQDDH
ncbi:hypothetical protein TWF481_002811 [Arthrobotrys musiformis]|uniref:Clr5 domain-containing protein n=1 Tax=Arthrobotrys musiformis TaxID=47236 RepID=A0AAV9VTF7_9PEZI